MKKLISCLLVVMMLFTMVSAFADDSVEKNNVVKKFLDETDLKTKDIAIQLESGDHSADLVFRLDSNSFHLVSREDGKVKSHIQLTPTGIYTGSAEAVTMMRYATIANILQAIVKEVDETIKEAINSIPAEALPTDAQVKEAAATEAIISAMAASQAQADAAVLASAAVSFVNKFKPEYILDVKEEDGEVKISLRSEAYASALADAMDELLSNPDLAALVDRKAVTEGGATFAAIQKNWAKNREATLESIRTMKDTDTIGEDGHWVSHFQIGDEATEKVLVADTDSWINPEDNEMEMKYTFGFKDEDPALVYEFSVSPDHYWEKLSSGEDMAEINLGFDENKVSDGNIVVVAGGEEIKMDFGQDYLNVKGPKGGISTSVRETWTGKQRFELYAETAEGQEDSIIIDFYDDDDSLICELSSDKADNSLKLKLSRIDKVEIEDLTASQNITEITENKITEELESLMKTVMPTAETAPEAGK